MTNTRYRNGRDLEYAVKNQLELNGYVAWRTPGSKGPADVIGIKRGEILLVQAKTGGYMDPAERTELYGLAALLGATPLKAFWHKDGRAARAVWFTELLSSEASQQRAWTPDHAFSACPLCPDTPAELGRCSHQRRATA